MCHPSADLKHTAVEGKHNLSSERLPLVVGKVGTFWSRGRLRDGGITPTAVKRPVALQAITKCCINSPGGGTAPSTVTVTVTQATIGLLGDVF